MSHQTGAMFSTLSAQTIELIATFKLIMKTQAAKEHAPTFQDWNIFLDIEESINRHAVKFAIGTRGKVGSMAGPLNLQI